MKSTQATREAYCPQQRTSNTSINMKINEFPTHKNTKNYWVQDKYGTDPDLKQNNLSQVGPETATLLNIRYPGNYFND
jgi:hypothetical protein